MNEPDYKTQGHRPSQSRDSLNISTGSLIILILMIIGLLIANYAGWLPQ